MSETDGSGAASPCWTIVIPVKSPSLAKTRLAPELGPAERAALARAFALDTVAAALAAPGVARVLVVGDEAALAGSGARSAEHVAEPAARGLRFAIADGIAAARASASVAVAVLLGDVPALLPEQLGAALDAATRHPLAFVRDADDIGTTLATARAGEPFEPLFGDGSAARHAAAGFVELDASAWPTLRRDVDTAASLADARALGVGPATAAALVALA